jgi:hypothetical protein
MPTPTSNRIAIQRKGAQRKVIVIGWLTLGIPAAAAAFTVVYESAALAVPRRPTKTFSSSRIALFQSSSKKEDSDDLLSLLDESILLYSLLVNKNNNTSATDDATDIGSLRKREIITLIEQVALSLPTSTTNDDNSVEYDETRKIAEIGGKLDETILSGYQSTFSKEEEDAWIQNVQTLSAEYETRLQRTEDLTVVLKQIPPKNKREEVTMVEQLSDRLDQMKTLIDPVGLIKSSAVVGKPRTTPNGEASSKRSSSQTQFPAEAKAYQNKTPAVSSNSEALMAPPNTAILDGNTVSTSLVEKKVFQTFASLSSQQSDVQDDENVNTGSAGVIAALLAAAIGTFVSLFARKFVECGIAMAGNCDAFPLFLIVSYLLRYSFLPAGAFALAPHPDLSLQSITPEPIIVRSVTPDPSPPSETSLWLLNTYK